MFQLSKKEFEYLRSQIATSKKDRGITQYRPYAFTEYGILQIAKLIITELGDSVKVFVIRAFVEIRKTLIGPTTARVMPLNGPRGNSNIADTTTVADTVTFAALKNKGYICRSELRSHDQNVK
jgi:hypothetical protein